MYFTKLILNSIKIEDVVEVWVEFGKKVRRKQKFVFLGNSFFFFSTEGVDGLGKARLFNYFLDFSCGVGGWVGVENEMNANSAFN